jgi:predicted tellurium resistance membrane protein TerC
MMIFAGAVGDFIQNHPSVRVLALAFLVLIGVMLVIEGTGGHVSKGYIYSAMGFSLFVQMLNLRMDAKRARAAAAAQHGIS